MWILSQSRTVLINVDYLYINKCEYGERLGSKYITCDGCENNKKGYCIKLNEIIKNTTHCSCGGKLFEGLYYFKCKEFTRLGFYNENRAKEILEEITDSLNENIVYKFPEE